MCKFVALGVQLRRKVTKQAQQSAAVDADPRVMGDNSLECRGTSPALTQDVEATGVCLPSPVVDVEVGQVVMSRRDAEEIEARVDALNARFSEDMHAIRRRGARFKARLEEIWVARKKWDAEPDVRLDAALCGLEKALGWYLEAEHMLVASRAPGKAGQIVTTQGLLTARSRGDSPMAGLMAAQDAVERAGRDLKMLDRPGVRKGMSKAGRAMLDDVLGQAARALKVEKAARAELVRARKEQEKEKVEQMRLGMGGDVKGKQQPTLRHRPAMGQVRIDRELVQKRVGNRFASGKVARPVYTFVGRGGK
jgi:hypothetical protein